MVAVVSQQLFFARCWGCWATLLLRCLTFLRMLRRPRRWMLLHWGALTVALPPVGLGPVNADEGTDGFQFLVGTLSETFFLHGVRERNRTCLWACCMAGDWRRDASCSAFSPLSSCLAEELHQLFEVCRDSFQKGEAKAPSHGSDSEPPWGRFSVLQVKLNDVYEGLCVEEIASSLTWIEATRWRHSAWGRTSRWNSFLSEEQLPAWKTAGSLGHSWTNVVWRQRRLV